MLIFCVADCRSYGLYSCNSCCEKRSVHYTAMSDRQWKSDALKMSWEPSFSRLWGKRSGSVFGLGSENVKRKYCLRSRWIVGLAQGPILWAPTARRAEAQETPSTERLSERMSLKCLKLGIACSGLLLNLWWGSLFHYCLTCFFSIFFRLHFVLCTKHTYLLGNIKTF